MRQDQAIAFKMKYGYLPEGRYPCQDCRCGSKDPCPGVTKEELEDWYNKVREQL